MPVTSIYFWDETESSKQPAVGRPKRDRRKQARARSAAKRARR